MAQEGHRPDHCLGFSGEHCRVASIVFTGSGEQMGGLALGEALATHWHKAACLLDTLQHSQSPTQKNKAMQVCPPTETLPT